MFYIVESDSQLEELSHLQYKEVFIHLILSNNNIHPKLNSLVGVYLRPIGLEGYFIPIAHDEGLNVGKERLIDVINSFDTKYTIDRKTMLYYFNLENVIDLSIKHNLAKHKQLEYSIEDSTINWFYSKHENNPNINKIIPISILMRLCDGIYKKVSKVIDLKEPSGFSFFNSTATNVFYLIENKGIGIKPIEFKDIYNVEKPEINIHNSTVYTKYNLNNITTRPTNAFNSVNFAAIPKKENYREVYTPENDIFIEFDFDGYHLRLIADLLNFKIEDKSAHTYLGKKMFNKENITEEEYKTAKQVNFQAIYGNIPKKYQNIVFFRQIKKYIHSLWEKFTENGYIENPISKIRFNSSLEDTNPTKLMNYMMQSLETANNIVILKNLLKYLNNRKSFITLYTYDSVIIDFCKEDGREVLENIQNIMECEGKYPVKFKYSNNLVL